MEQADINTVSLVVSAICLLILAIRSLR